MSGASKGRGLRLRVGDRAWVTDDGWQAFAMFVGGGHRSGLATRADAFQAAESILRGGL